MKMSDIVELTDDELNKQLNDGRKELLNLRIQGKTGTLENPMLLRSARKTVARCLTELNKRKQGS